MLKDSENFGQSFTKDPQSFIAYPPV